jgi:hypothetical protein
MDFQRAGRTLFLAAFGLALACCAVVALPFWMADPLRLSAPSDQTLIATFHDHRAAFEQLRQMAIEDAQHGPFNPFVEKKLPDSRRQKYRDLQYEIHVDNDVGAAGSDDTVRFEFSWGGLSAIGSEWRKGIEYIPGNKMEHAEELLPSLDKPSALPYGMYTREIEPNWFIYYDYID